MSFGGILSAISGSGGGSSTSSGGGWSSMFSGSNSGFWGALLSGVSSYASSRSTEKAAEKAGEQRTGEAIAVANIQGEQQRRTSAFERQLDEYYKQEDRKRKRVALDTYGAFSQLSRFAPPSYQQPAVPQSNPFPQG